MNIKELKEMINLMNEHGLAEIELEKDNMKIKLKKQPTGVITRDVSEAPKSEPGSAAGAGLPAQRTPSETIPADEYVVCSPMVGTFYAAANPESEPYVSVGKFVKPDDVLCIIEAMKLMNEIKSETAGTIIEILVKNGQAVEYDQPLFRIKKS